MSHYRSAVCAIVATLAATVAMAQSATETPRSPSRLNALMPTPYDPSLLVAVWRTAEFAAASDLRDCDFSFAATALAN